ncbi:MAG: glucosaminidase domain-containing protein [Thermoleophilia bacterium]
MRPIPSIKSLLIIILALAWLGALLPGAALAVSPDDPVAGISNISPAQLEAELSNLNPGHIHPQIAQLYVEWGYRFGIRADVAFAQMLHETNYLRYGGDVSPSQNNFAGIGATGGGNPGNSFASAEAGVIAHYAHLAWYVFPDHVNSYCNSTFDPRHFGTGHQNTVHIIRDLGGRWAVPGTGYGDALARIATNEWNYNLQGHWLGSFNEVPGTASDALSTTWYFTWYDSKPANGMVNNWILIGNQGTGTARVQLTVGDSLVTDADHPDRDYWEIPEGGRITPSITDFIGGPVKAESLDGQPLIASQRVLYRDTFNEVPGIRAEQLADSWDFTWYDSLPENGMAGNWILVANMGPVPADVEIYVGDTLMAEYKAANGTALPAAGQPGAIVTPQFPRTINGPVRVVSTNHQPLIASQRVLFRDSFNEVTGVPTRTLGSEYFFTWYDSSRANGMYGDWVLIANRGDTAADVDVYIGSQLKAQYRTADGNAIPVGGIVTPVFPGVTDGPVRVVSTNGQKLMASQRVIFRDSFEEVQGIPPTGFSSRQLFTWYDSTLINYMRGNWILVANQGTGDATVEVYIDGIKMHDPDTPANDFFTIPEGGRITPQFANTMGGPVRVVCLTGQPLLMSQRVLFKDGMIR